MMIQAAATTMSSDKGNNNGEDGDQGWQKTIVGAHYFWNKKIKIE